MRCALCSTSRRSTRVGSTTCPPVSRSLRPHRSWRRYARLILPNWTASSRRAGSDVTEGATRPGRPPQSSSSRPATVPTGHFSRSLRAGREPALSRPPPSDSATHAPSANGTAERCSGPASGSDTARVSTHVGGPPPTPVAVATHAPAIRLASVHQLPPARIGCLRTHRRSPAREVRVDSTLPPVYNLSDQPGRGVLFSADLGSLCLPIQNVDCGGRIRLRLLRRR